MPKLPNIGVRKFDKFTQLIYSLSIVGIFILSTTQIRIRSAQKISSMLRHTMKSLHRYFIREYQMIASE